MAQRQDIERRQGATLPWPPDDTEESVVGIDLHQEVITDLRTGLVQAAAAAAAIDPARGWAVSSQTHIDGFHRPDGSAYRTLPDVFIYRRPNAPRRGRRLITEDGPPLLVIEVLSEATFQSDMNLERGKGYSYAAAGVPEYLIYDPWGDYAPQPIVAWRLEGKVYVPWQPDSTGRWQSREIDAAFALEETRAVVYTRDGRRMVRESEVYRALTERDAELARLRQLLAERNGGTPSDVGQQE